VSVTSELPVADLSSRRRDHAAVIPFPRPAAERPSAAARQSAKAAHPAGKGRVDRARAVPVRPRAGVLVRPVPPAPERSSVPEGSPGLAEHPTPMHPPELTVVPSARSLYLVPAANPASSPYVEPEWLPGPTAPSRAASGPATSDPAAGPVRLTRRGRLVLTALGTLLLAAIITFVAPAVAHLRSAPAVPASAPAVVVVQPGDTLWSIAHRVAPDRDTRRVVADLRRLNALPTADVHPGQRLQIRRP